MVRFVGDVSLRTRLLGGFGIVVALLIVVGGLSFWGSLAQSSYATRRTKLDEVVRQVDLIRYYDADVSGWQVALALDVQTGAAPKNGGQDANRVAEMVDKAALAQLLPRFPVQDLTRTEARKFQSILASWATFWRIDSRIFALYVMGNPRSVAAANTLTNGASTDAFTALSNETVALSGAVNDRSSHLAARADATGSTVRMLIAIASGLALALAAGLGAAITRTLTHRVNRAKARLNQIADGINDRLKPGIEALAAGDLTVKLVVGTTAIEDLPGDEIGDIMRTGERLRGVIIDCYKAYNKAVADLRQLISEVSSTAVSIGDTSQQVAVTSDEAAARPRRSRTRSRMSQTAPSVRCR